MASKKITAMPSWGGNQVPTDLITGVDLSAALANQNVKSTLNDLFSIITKNITDGAVRFQEFTAPAVSGAGEGALYFDDTDKTFKGSRNGGAYDDLLFGSGSNQQVSVFTSSPDLVSGYAPFTYNSVLERLYITDTVFSPTMEISKTGTSPAYAKIFGGQGFASLGNWSVTAAAPAYLNFYRGANGPAYPTNGMDIGSIRFRPAIDASDTPTTVGGARIDVRATENATAGVGGGVGLTIFTAANGQVNDNPRFLINYLGAVMVGVNSATITTNTGTDTKTVLGELVTYDADAVHQIGNPSVADSKILVIQGQAGQTKALTEWQTSAGAFLFSIGAAGSHSYGGATGIAVSAAGQARVYFDSGLNQLRVSQNGGAYANLVNPLSPGGTTGSIQYNTGAGLIDGDTYFLWDSASATIQIGSASVLSGKILLRNSTNANTLTIQPGATGGNITFTLPTGVGSSGQFLQTDGAGVLSWAAAGAVSTLTIGTTAIASGAAGRILYETSGNVLGEIAGSSADANGAVLFGPTARSSGTQYYFAVQSPADTGITANSEAVGIDFDLSATRTWNAGTVAKQREAVFRAPIYAGTSATATFTEAATVSITGAPTAGANGAITSPVALLVESGQIYLNYTGTRNYGNLLGTGTLTHSFGINGNIRAQFAEQGGGAWFQMSNGTVTSEYGVVASGVFFGPRSSVALIFRVAIAEAARITTNKSFLVNSSTENAQLYAVSSSASRVGLRIDSASNATVALNQFYLNADDTATVALHSVFSVDSNGTAANGFGGQLQFQLESSTTNQQNAASINWYWIDATHATRTAALQFQIVGNAAALTTMAEIDVPTVAGDTALKIYDLDNATLERVSVGAADSGGTGYKVLRIPN